MARDYLATPIRREHTPPPKSDYRKYRPCLRLQFEYQCTYCLSFEAEVAQGEHFGGFEIDHFRPHSHRTFRRFRNTYSNLLWACHACNRAKSNTWPTEVEIRNGYRFVDPRLEALGDHLRIRGEEVEAITKAGEYICDELNLNSELHRKRRRDRREKIVKTTLLQAMAQISRESAPHVPDTLEVQNALDQLGPVEEELRWIESMLGSIDPWDKETECLCSNPQ